MRPLSPAEEVAGGAWRYPGRLARYDGSGPLTGERGYVAVVDAETDGLVGFACAGAEARVAGQPAEVGVLDVGYGLRPDLVHQGHGRAFGAAVMAWAGEVAAEQGRRTLRTTVLDWNVASLSVCRRLGFVETGAHVNDEGRFLILLRGVEWRV